jgi:hypothetical protein
MPGAFGLGLDLNRDTAHQVTVAGEDVDGGHVTRERDRIAAAAVHLGGYV